MEQPLPDWKSLRDSACPPERRAALQALAQQRTGTTPRPHYHRLSAEEMRQRQQDHAPMLSAARPHLDWLSTLLSDTTHIIGLADADGVLLQTTGNWPDPRASGLSPGYVWSERVMGANGIGTAISSSQAVVVVAEAYPGAAFRARVCTAAPIRSPHGRITGAIEISTPADEADPERLLLVAHTAMIIEQALDAAARMAQAESMKLLALLSSFTAHELVSPLTATKTVLDLLSREALPAEAVPLLAAARRNADRLLQVVEELRILGGSHDGCLRPTHLLELVQQSIAQTGLANSIELDSALTAQSTHISCNPNLLIRALANLLRNAREATAGHGEIGVQLLEAGDRVQIVVWDTGPGIPPERWHSLFEESFTTKPGGSGLGMLLAKAIVERVHDGQLRFRPNQPRGCRFELELPLSC